jgi:hypothetical protein
MNDEKTYFSYLLRLWQINLNGERAWKASLENPNNGTLQVFESIYALCRFFETQTKLNSKETQKEITR